MATLALMFQSHYHSYFGVGGAGASDEPCFISKTAGVYTHLQPIKFRVKQDKRVRPEMEGNGGEMLVHRHASQMDHCCISDHGKGKNKAIYGERHPDLLKKYPLASNCCRSMNFPLYSMIRESGAKSRTALRIFLFFWT